MRGEGLNAERFGRVMAAEKKIDSQFLRGNRSPMRRFAGNEGVDFLLRDPINFRAGSAGYDPTLFISVGPKLNVFIGPRNAVLSFRINAARGSVFFVFNPISSPRSSRNGFVFLNPSAAASRALLPTSE